MKLHIVFGLLALSFSVQTFATGALPDNRISAGDKVVVDRSQSNDVIVLTRPAQLKYTKIYANGDGTVTIEGPRFFARGEWMSFYGHHATTRNRICSLLNRNYVYAPDSTVNQSGGYEVMAVYFNDNSPIAQFVRASTSTFIKNITCMRDRNYREVR